MKCCLCDKKIELEENGWDSGHNAQPIRDGRCCDNCNYNKVMPIRLKELYGV
tara:strand:- start:353 stop:508 length:156 start_codon:yes stop_codon:yes gene_type:complete